MNAEHLFTLPADAFQATSDDCYTPRWVFDAMGLDFDLDVAAPPGGPWHVPAKRYFTAEDDGLAQGWGGGARLVQPALLGLLALGRQVGRASTGRPNGVVDEG